MLCNKTKIETKRRNNCAILCYKKKEKKEEGIILQSYAIKNKTKKKLTRVRQHETVCFAAHLLFNQPQPLLSQRFLLWCQLLLGFFQVFANGVVDDLQCTAMTV